MTVTSRKLKWTIIQRLWAFWLGHALPDQVSC